MSENTQERAETAPADDADESSETEKSGKPKRGFLYFLRDVAFIILAAIVISFLIKTFLIRSFYIPSPSMEDTLLVNDRIIVNQLEPALTPISRGDVVVFKDPGGWLTPNFEAPKDPVSGFFDWLGSIVGLTAPDSNDHLIKRVIGLPGDTVSCCDDFGRMSVNGVPLDESAYVKLPPGITAVSKDPFEVTVPEGSLWVMGDNRWNSQDSRYNRDKPGNGFVPISNVVGRAVLISWPVSRWTWLDNYPLVFDGVENGGTPTPAPSATTTSGG
ncbi:MAG: signal peptidase I [Leifsonia xyli]|nr:MAG: signal peptidase I [Leifsonia xyli]